MHLSTDLQVAWFQSNATQSKQQGQVRCIEMQLHPRFASPCHLHGARLPGVKGLRAEAGWAGLSLQWAKQYRKFGCIYCSSSAILVAMKNHAMYSTGAALNYPVMDRFCSIPEQTFAEAPKELHHKSKATKSLFYGAQVLQNWSLHPTLYWRQRNQYTSSDHTDFAL